MKRDSMTDIDYLLQTDLKDVVVSKLGKEAWVTAYSSRYRNGTDISFFSALIPSSMTKDILGHQSWDLSIGDGLPGFSRSHNGEEEVVEYHRFSSGAIEPLVIYRSFHNLKPPYVEILEEFRLFHNLYHDKKTDTFTKIDEDGNEEEVVRIRDGDVTIKLLAIRQFLAAKDMQLVIFMDSIRYSPLTADEVGTEEQRKTLTGQNYTFSFSVGDATGLAEGNHKSLSRLVGKKLIFGLSKDRCGIWPFDEANAQEYVEFIIGTDEEGDKEVYTCNPDKLANYFGANPDAPNYLTPVFFKREVLAKYYAHTEKYSVQDGFVRCGSLWLLRIDNNIGEYVSAFLGDLGRDLSHNEQLYWRNFNVIPESSISRVNFKRSFLGEPAEPERADLLFKYRLELLQDSWHRKYGWLLFLPLTKDDRHYLDALRIPLNDSQAEFDSQILGLTKILVDSLNESQISRELSGLEPNTKGISKFEKFLEDKRFSDTGRAITFLRGLQSLRSTGVAHRKGSTYERLSMQLGLEAQPLSKIFEKMLLEAGEIASLLTQF